MKVDIPKHIIERFLVCIDYAEHGFSCNEAELRKDKPNAFLKIPNCPFLGQCNPTKEPIAEVAKAFRKALKQ